MLVVETNRYANVKKNAAGLSRIRKWDDTNELEIKLFFGIVMWMGMVKMPSIAHYWKNLNYIFAIFQNVCPETGLKLF